MKRLQRGYVTGHAVVLEVPTQYRPQRRSHHRNGLMEAVPEVDREGLQLGLPSLAHRLPKHHKLSIPRGTAAVRETEKIESLWFPLAPGSPVLARKAAKFQEPGLVRV